MTPYCRL